MSCFNSSLEEVEQSSIIKIPVTNGTIAYGVLVVTDLVPDGKHAFGFIITGGLMDKTAKIWKNLNNGSTNVTFNGWADNARVDSGTVSGILLCI